MKTNILQLITSIDGGGAQRLLLLYSDFYNAKRFNLHVVSLRSGNFERKFKRSLGRNFTCLNLQRRISLKAIIKLIKYIKKNRVHVVSTHLIEADIYGLLIKILCPYISLFTVRHARNKLKERPYTGILHFIYMGIVNFFITIPTKKVICVSKGLKAFIRKYEFVPSSKLIHVYNGIDMNLFYNENKSELRKKFIETEEKKEFLIGIVGRLVDGKGHDYLFKAVKKLVAEEIDDIKVLVLGEGVYLNTLKNLRNKLDLKNKIKFLGFQKNIRDFYNIFDLLCVPSEIEGFGYIIIEAMACETLVLSSDIPGPNEIISHGINGFLFKNGNVEDLAQKIKEIRNNTYNLEKIKKNALKTVKENFNIIQMVKRYENIYQKYS